jgi:single-strand DNA-binding protein
MVVVIGNLAKPLQVRNLPSGLTLACFDLQVQRPDQSIDTVPVALFDVGEQAAGWKAGDELLAVGRVRRRFFRVGGSTQSRTELVAERVIPLANKQGVSMALAQAGQTLAGVLDQIGPD